MRWIRKPPEVGVRGRRQAGWHRPTAAIGAFDVLSPAPGPGPWEERHLDDRVGGSLRVPRRVVVFGAILRSLLVAGVPLGPNRLVTIRGRKSGLPRTTALAVIEVSGRRWVWAPWGEVQWVRNLRAAGRATIDDRGHREEVTATELDRTERVAFFRDTLGPLARSIPFGPWFVRIADGVDLGDPVRVAADRRVFELQPLR